MLCRCLLLFNKKARFKAIGLALQICSEDSLRGIAVMAFLVVLRYFTCEEDGVGGMRM